MAKAHAEEKKAESAGVTPMEVMVHAYDALGHLGGTGTTIVLGDWAHVPNFLFPKVPSLQSAVLAAPWAPYGPSRPSAPPPAPAASLSTTRRTTRLLGTRGTPNPVLRPAGFLAPRSETSYHALAMGASSLVARSRSAFDRAASVLGRPGFGRLLSLRARVPLASRGRSGAARRRPCAVSHRGPRGRLVLCPGRPRSRTRRRRPATAPTPLLGSEPRRYTWRRESDETFSSSTEQAPRPQDEGPSEPSRCLPLKDLS